MADKPLNINSNQRRVAAQSGANPVLEASFESVPAVYDQSLGGATETLNVEGVSYMFCYGGGAVTCCDTPGGTFVALEDRAGAAVVITTARLVEVRGVHYVKFAADSRVVFTG